MKDNFENYPKGTFFSEFFSELFGEGIFGVDGKKWRVQRKLARCVCITHSSRQQSLFLSD